VRRSLARVLGPTLNDVMIGNRITARRALPSPGTVRTTLERDRPFSITVPTRARHSRPRALPLPLPAYAIGSNGSLPASWETAPAAADRLRCRPAGSGDDDLTYNENELCVDCSLASFGAFWGVFTPQGRLCRTRAPWHGRSAASVPSSDKIPILSFVESSMTRLESFRRSDAGSPLASARCSRLPRSHPGSPCICHPPSGICHPPFVIRHLCIPIPRSAFRILRKGVERPQQLSGPGGLVATVALESRAAIERRAVAPLGGVLFLDFLVLGQQLLEPADVLIDDRAVDGQGR
jgi:hypothetical protein